MISLMDQEDLDIAITTSKKAARRERVEYGKLEVRIPVSLDIAVRDCSLTDPDRFGWSRHDISSLLATLFFRKLAFFGCMNCGYAIYLFQS